MIRCTSVVLNIAFRDLYGNKVTQLSGKNFTKWSNEVGLWCDIYKSGVTRPSVCWGRVRPWVAEHRHRRRDPSAPLSHLRRLWTCNFPDFLLSVNQLLEFWLACFYALLWYGSAAFLINFSISIAFIPGCRSFRAMNAYSCGFSRCP